jgi:hypothetical protein
VFMYGTLIATTMSCLWLLVRIGQSCFLHRTHSTAWLMQPARSRAGNKQVKGSFVGKDEVPMTKLMRKYDVCHHGTHMTSRLGGCV